MRQITRTTVASLALASVLVAVGDAEAATARKPSAAQTSVSGQAQCANYGGGIHCSGGSTAQQYGAQREARLGAGGSTFDQQFAAALRTGADQSATQDTTAAGHRRITTYSDGTMATITQYGRHSVMVFSDGRVLRCEMFGTQRVCN